MKMLNSEKLEKNIDLRMAGDQESGKVGGSGIAVMQNGKEIYKKYFGKFSYSGESCSEVGDTTLFRLASMTKPVTAAAVLIQAERGRLFLDRPISDWLPEFKDMDIGAFDGERHIIRVRKSPVQLTLRHLLSHTNGLCSGDLGYTEYNQIPPEQHKTLKSVVEYLSGVALDFEPMTAQGYSATAAFDVAARLVELTSDMSYDMFLKKNIFEPCEMGDTTFFPTEDQWQRTVIMHRRTDDGRSADSQTIPGCVFENMPATCFSAGAGLLSSLPDYVKFAEMLCRGGRTADGRQLLSPRLINEMGSPWVSDSIMPGPQKWGLGVRVICAPYHMPEHSFGWSGAYGSHFWVDPVNQITAVYMKNSRYDGGAGCVTSVNFERDVYNALE